MKTLKTAYVHDNMTTYVEVFSNSKQTEVLKVLEVLLSKSEQARYNAGEVAQGVRADTLTKVRVQKNKDGKMCLVITSANAYTKVNPYTQEASALNLTAEETKQAMQEGTIKVYRSSGYKDGDKVLTREEQIARGVARVVHVVASLKEGANKDSNNPSDYTWHIMGDNATRLEVIG